MAVKSFPVHELSKIRTMDMQYWDNSQNAGMSKNRLKLQYKLYVGKQSTGRTYESFFNMDDNKNRNLKQKIHRVLKDQDQAAIDAFYDQVKQMFDDAKKAGQEIWFGFRVETFAKKDSKGRTVMLNGRALRNSVTDSTCYCWAYPKRIGGQVVSIDVTVLVTRIDEHNVEHIDAIHVCVDKPTKKSPKNTSDLIGYWVKGDTDEATDAAICATATTEDEEARTDGTTQATLAHAMEQPQLGREVQDGSNEDVPSLAQVPEGEGMGTCEQPEGTSGHGETGAVGGADTPRLDDPRGQEAQSHKRPVSESGRGVPLDVAARVRQLGGQHVDSSGDQLPKPGSMGKSTDAGRPSLSSEAGSDRDGDLTDDQIQAMKDKATSDWRAYVDSMKKPMNLGTAKTW